MYTTSVTNPPTEPTFKIARRLAGLLRLPPDISVADPPAAWLEAQRREWEMAGAMCGPGALDGRGALPGRGGGAVAHAGGGI